MKNKSVLFLGVFSILIYINQYAIIPLGIVDVEYVFSPIVFVRLIFVLVTSFFVLFCVLNYKIYWIYFLIYLTMYLAVLGVSAPEKLDFYVKKEKLKANLLKCKILAQNTPSFFRYNYGVCNCELFGVFYREGNLHYYLVPHFSNEYIIGWPLEESRFYFFLDSGSVNSYIDLIKVRSKYTKISEIGEGWYLSTTWKYDRSNYP